MIYQALKILVNEVNSYLNSFGNISDDIVILGNISQIDLHVDGQANNNNALENKIVLTLVNIQEEKSLKNLPSYSKINSHVIYHNPPIHLNLYLLFSIASSNYDNALIYLSRVIGFFQGKNIFTNINSPVPIVTPPIEDIEFFRLIVDLCSLSFEESNHLWATLGGKQLPAILYKLRLCAIDVNNTNETRPAIQEIITSANVI